MSHRDTPFVEKDKKGFIARLGAILRQITTDNILHLQNAQHYQFT
jgi:hypothetical protein